MPKVCLQNYTMNDISELKNLNMGMRVLTQKKEIGQGSENFGHYDHFYSRIAKDRKAQQGLFLLVRENRRRYLIFWKAVNSGISKLKLRLGN